MSCELNRILLRITMTSRGRSSAFKNIFHALKYRNFRIFFIGQSVSLIGTWIQFVAMSWLVYRLTGSPFMLGVVGFAGQIPTFILSPVAGILADRWDRRKMLVFTQVSAMVLASILAFLTLTGIVTVGQIVILGILLGCVTALDIPARHSFILNMVGDKKESLSNAIALNSLMFNAARLIGPAAAGALIAAVGEGVCFLLNAVSFLAVIASLLVMRLAHSVPKAKRDHALQSFIEGFRYTFGFTPIRAVLLLLGVISLVGMSYVVLMPVFAKNILKGGPETLGVLMSSAGVGALIATFFLASRSSIVRIGYVLPAASAVFAVGIAGFSFSRNVWISSLLMVLAGFGFMTHMAASNIVLQTIVDDDKRGRVMSFYSMAFMGMAPLGSLLAGMIASRIGAPNTLLAAGVLCMLFSLLFARKVPALCGAVGHIYDRIEPSGPVMNGINAAVELAVPPEDL